MLASEYSTPPTEQHRITLAQFRVIQSHYHHKQQQEGG